MKAGYQGKIGAYSFLAGKKYFSKNSEMLDFKDFQSLFKALEKEAVEAIVLPIENSLAGTVTENYDLLFKNQVWILGEIYLPIKHQLVAKNKSNFSEIKKVYSMYKALEQCQSFFENNPKIEALEFSNTAASAEFVAKSEDQSIAAICSKEASESFGLKILKKDIQDDKNNWTRFLVVKKEQIGSFELSKETGSNKASLVYSLIQDVSGGLVKSLIPFEMAQINLTSIESRPIAGKFFEHLFYVDLEFTDFCKLEKALVELKKVTSFVKILGVYSKATLH